MHWEKIDYLVNAIDLQPWYMTVSDTPLPLPGNTSKPPARQGASPLQAPPGSPAPGGSLPGSPSPGSLAPAAGPSQPPQSGPVAAPSPQPASPQPPQGGPAAAAVPQPAPSLPPRASTPSPSPATTPAAQAPCNAIVSIGYPWSEGSKRMNTVNLVSKMHISHGADIQSLTAYPPNLFR